MGKPVSDSVLCPRCRDDLSSTAHHGQATCPHCEAPVLFADADGHDTDCLALPVQFAEFITDGVIARRGGEVILHGWHKSGDPEVVIKLWSRSGPKPPKPNRHPNVVRSLKAGTAAGFDFQVYEWSEGRVLDSAADLLTPPGHLHPRGAVSSKATPPAEAAATQREQSEPLPVLTEADSPDLPSFGAPCQSQLNRRLHNGLLRGLGINGLGCSKQMAGFLADGICVSLYAICATLITVQTLSTSMVDAVWATPWLAWQWFWLRHYRSFLSWKARTVEIIVAVLIVVLNLANDVGFWRGVFAVVVLDTCLTAFMVWRTLRCRFGQRIRMPVSPTSQQTDQPKSAEDDFFQSWPGWIVSSICLAAVSYWYYDGEKILVPMKGGKGAMPFKTDHGRRSETDRRNAEEQVKNLTDAIAKSTDPLEQAKTLPTTCAGISHSRKERSCRIG